ncbi:hyaluronidase-2-like [Gastrophryne carolinensis]
MTRLTLYVLLCFLVLTVGCSSGVELDKPTIRPILSKRPFTVVWNAPTQDCPPRFDVPLNLKLFDFSASPNEGWVNQNLTIFYKERLGLYPYFDEHNVSINGGVPQNTSILAHLDRLPDGIKKYIPNTEIDGLAVIDWEEWRPIWLRNWKPKDIYRQASRQLVSSRHPEFTNDEVSKAAQYEFETSARDFMTKTLKYTKNIRPRQLWGFYLFPDCYNHDYLNNRDTYTGKCPDVETSRNDLLAWLWEESTALYPSIYLDPSLESTANSRKFVHYRVKEAMRIAYKHHNTTSLPVFVYTRPTYIRTLKVLSQTDLVSTIGESAAQGAAGVIFWGDADYTKNKETCQMIKTYLEGDLGRYIVNVTSAASLCSQVLCGGNGRCLRKENVTDAFLHLNPASFSIVRATPGMNVSAPLWADGRLSKEDISLMHEQFRCQCYVDWYGKSCGLQRNTHSSDQQPVSGGLPQNASLQEHLEKAQQDLEEAMVNRNFSGVAVVDWEQWRPLWSRNWNNLSLYQMRSLQLVSQRHPQWPYWRLRKEAKRQFEEEAQKFMVATLQLAVKMIPHGLWGFYGYPDCYNYGYNNSCSEEEKQKNDAMSWLWRNSHALYPSIYVNHTLRDAQLVGSYVRHRVLEGLRVSAGIPVLPYARIVYLNSMDFLSQEDLIETIGQSAALGASGIVLWGNSDYSRSKESCLAVRSYLEKTLGHYIKNVTKAATLCSHTLCSGNGRCVRKFLYSDTYLHLNATSFTIQQNGRGFTVQTLPAAKSPNHPWPHFQCHCYKSWGGQDCSQKTK